MDTTKVTLSSMTKAQIYKAFEKARDEVDITNGNLVLITEDMYDALIEFALQHFAAAEPLSIAIGSHTVESAALWSKEFRNTLESNMSLALMDKTNEEIIGMCLISIGDSSHTYNLEECVVPAYKAYVEFTMYCDKAANYFEHHCVDECIHIYFVAVHSKHSRRGFATALMDTAVRFAGHLGVDPVYLKGEGSSKFSQRLFEKFGFETSCDIQYADYVVDGEEIISREVTGEHTSQRVYIKPIGGINLK